MADGRVVISILADDKEYMAKIQQLNSKTNQAVGTIGTSLASAGKALTLGLTAPLAAAGAAVIKVAADFEGSMNEVKAATGASGSEMKNLEQLAIDLGASTKYSANEAAQAMIALAKGGLEPAQIKAGALESALNLATVGEMGLAQAADLTVQTMGMFGIKAENAQQVTTALAGAAAKSTADVADLAQGLQQAGASASSIGWSLNETTAVLAAFADQGIRGSDAGTSLKTMMMRLTPQTDKAAAAMEKYGLKFSDASGNMDDAATVAQKLQDALGGLSAEERNRALAIMFGADAQRAAIVLMNAGKDTINDYIAATKDQAYATELANAKMKGAKGAVEEARGAIETAAISFGKRLLPAVEDAANTIGGLFDWLTKLTPAQKDFVIQIAATAAAIGPLSFTVGKLMKAYSATQKGLAAFMTGLRGVEKASGSTAEAIGTLLNRSIMKNNPELLKAAKSTSEVASASKAASAATAAQTATTTAASTANKTLATATAASTAATKASEAATKTSTAATTANAAATAAAGVETKKFTVFNAAATTAQTAFNAVMAMSPIAKFAIALGLAGAALGAFRTAMSVLAPQQEALTVATERQQEKVDALSNKYDEAVKQHGKFSDEAMKLKGQLDQEKAALEATGQTASEFGAHVEDAAKAHEDLFDEVSKSTGEAYTSSAAIKALGDEYIQLSQKTNKTSDDKKRMLSIVTQLNEKVDGLNASYDAQSGELIDLSTNTKIADEALQKMIDTQSKRNIFSASLKNYNKLQEENTRLTALQQRAQENLSKAQKDAAPVWDILNNKINIYDGGIHYTTETSARLDDNLRTVNKTLEENKAQLDEATAIVEMFGDKQTLLSEGVNLLNEGMDANTAAQLLNNAAKDESITAAELEAEYRQQAIDQTQDQTQTIQELTEEQVKAVQAIQELSANNAAFAESMVDSGMTTAEFAVKLQEAGVDVEAFASKVQSYTDQIIDGNNRIKENTEITMESMGSAMDANIATVKDYTEQYSQLMDRGGGEGHDALLQWVAKMGPEATPLLRDLNNASDAELAEFEKKFAEAGKAAKEAGLTEVGLMKDDTVSKVAEMNSAVGAEAAKLPGAIQEGIQSTASQVDDALSGVGDNAVNTLNDKRGQMKEAGANVTQGAAEGIKSKEGEVKQSTTQVADAANKSMNDTRGKYQQTGQDLMQSAADGMEDKTSMVSGNSRAVAIEAANTASDQYNSFYNAGQNLGQGMADGIAAKSSAIESAARNAAIRAYNAAQRALDSHSPSRKGRWLGGTFSQGLALGIKDDAHMLEDETIKAIKDAERAAKNYNFKSPILSAPELRGYSTVSGANQKYGAAGTPSTTVNVNIASFNNFDTKRDSKQLSRVLNTELSRAALTGRI